LFRIDWGGSGCKAVLLDRFGATIGGSSVPYRSRRSSAGEVTKRPSYWERAVSQAARSVLERAPGTEVVGLALTAPAHAVALVGRDGQLAAPALRAQDARPDEVARQLSEAHREQIFTSTMVPVSSGWSVAQMAWVADTDPELVKKTRWVLPVEDYLRYKLTWQMPVGLS
jgi:sugar (pentulose or hexulose) kinase